MLSIKVREAIQEKHLTELDLMTHQNQIRNLGINTYMTIYKTDNQQEPTESIEKCTQYFVIRYKGKEPENIYILKMESLCWTPKTNTTL